MMIKFGESKHPVFRATSPSLEECSKANEVENYLYTFCADGDTIDSVFAQSFLSTSSVSTEQSQICVRNTVPDKQQRGTRVGRTV